MDMQGDKNEIVGRLWLWALAISKTRDLLDMALRIQIGKHQETQITERDDYNRRLNDFDKSQPNYREGYSYHINKKKFDAENPRTFPTWIECCGLYDSTIELAIVYFSQVFNSGDGVSGSSAKNELEFRKKHWPPIIDSVLKTETDQLSFDILKKKILDVRNKTIGHADGTAFGIHHGQSVSKMSGPQVFWREIDIDYWYSLLEPLYISTMNYMNSIKLMPTTPNSQLAPPRTRTVSFKRRLF